MKTHQECKDEVAKKYGHDSWERLQNLNPTWEYDEAAELYAQQFKDELEQGAEYVVRLSDSIGKLCDENSRLLEEKAKLIEENTWVSVKDRLPEQDTWILAYSLRAFRFSNQMVCLHGESGKFYAKGFELHPDEITHWKPLTSPQ